MEVKLQYLFTLVRGELLHQFDSLYDDVEGTNPLTVENLIFELAEYFLPVNLLSKQKRAMRRGMRTPMRLKARSYVDFLIDVNKYLDFSLGQSCLKNWCDGDK